MQIPQILAQQGIFKRFFDRGKPLIKNGLCSAQRRKAERRWNNIDPEGETPLTAPRALVRHLLEHSIRRLPSVDSQDDP